MSTARYTTNHTKFRAAYQQTVYYTRACRTATAITVIVKNTITACQTYCTGG